MLYGCAQHYIGPTALSTRYSLSSAQTDGRYKTNCTYMLTLMKIYALLYQITAFNFFIFCIEKLFWYMYMNNVGSHAPVLHLCSDTVTASDHVRVLGVTFSSDLRLEKHVSKTCSASFHWLRQLRRVRKSLDDESAATQPSTFMLLLRLASTIAMHSMQGRRKRLLTSFNECLMRPHV